MTADINDFTKLMKTAPLGTHKPDNGNNVTCGNIWDAYTAMICEQEMVYYQKRKDRVSGNAEGEALNEKWKKITVYFGSTEARKMMSRYIVLNTLKRQPFRISEVSAALRVTYKAAGEMVNDAVSLGVVKKIDKDRYGGECDFIDHFQRIYMHDVYHLSSETERLRQLVTEFGWFERHCQEFACREERCIEY